MSFEMYNEGKLNEGKLNEGKLNEGKLNEGKLSLGKLKSYFLGYCRNGCLDTHSTYFHELIFSCLSSLPACAYQRRWRMDFLAYGNNGYAVFKAGGMNV